MSIRKLLLLCVFIPLSACCQQIKECDFFDNSSFVVSSLDVNKCKEEWRKYSTNQKVKLVSWLISTGKNKTLNLVLENTSYDLVELNRTAAVPFEFLAIDALSKPVEMVKLLESNGINFNESKLGDRNVVYYLIELNREELLDYFYENEKYHPLFINKLNFFAAAASGNKEMILFLLEKGLDPQIIDEKGNSIIDYAKAKKHAEFILFLENIISKSIELKK